MTISETIKHAVGLEAGPSTRTFHAITILQTQLHLQPLRYRSRANNLPPCNSALHARSSIALLRASCWSIFESTAASREEMSDARLPIQYRDTCAHLLIPLNRCRHNEYYLPWKCEVRLFQHILIPKYT